MSNDHVITVWLTCDHLLHSITILSTVSHDVSNVTAAHAAGIFTQQLAIAIIL